MTGRNGGVCPTGPALRRVCRNRLRPLARRVADGRRSVAPCDRQCTAPRGHGRRTLSPGVVAHFSPNARTGLCFGLLFGGAQGEPRPQRASRARKTRSTERRSWPAVPSVDATPKKADSAEWPPVPSRRSLEPARFRPSNCSPAAGKVCTSLCAPPATKGVTGEGQIGSGNTPTGGRAAGHSVRRPACRDACNWVTRVPKIESG